MWELPHLTKREHQTYELQVLILVIPQFFFSTNDHKRKQVTCLRGQGSTLTLEDMATEIRVPDCGTKPQKGI